MVHSKMLPSRKPRQAKHIGVKVYNEEECNLAYAFRVSVAENWVYSGYYISNIYLLYIRQTHKSTTLQGVTADAAV